MCEGWHFQCCCARCVDPEEAGAHTNTMVCLSCSSPCLLPTSPLDWEASWRCTHCGKEETAREVLRTVEEFLAEVTKQSASDR